MGERWQWTSRLRIWEANRKVFLQPENWLEPESEDDAAQPPPTGPRPRFGGRRRAKGDLERRD